MNKFYKLNVGFKPWWCEAFQQVYPSNHIENILKEEYWSYQEDDVDPSIYGYWWKEIKNVQINENTLYLECDNKEIPLYIKYTTEDKVFYFYLYSKAKISTVNKNGLSIYGCVYFMDKYMTIYFDKLQILYKANPLVKFNYKYCVPWIKKSENDYEFNFVKKKELSSYINDVNYELIRNEIFSITEQELYNQLNIDNIPDKYKWLKEPSNTGRYRYIVLKSSALTKKANDKIVPKEIKQTNIVVPIKNNEVLNEINNINFEAGKNEKLIIGDNFIGIFECDVPFSFLYGLSLKDNNIKFLYDDYGIQYFEIPINYYNRNILISYINYEKGFYGKLKYLINNLNEVKPETEIALLAPQYYREVYNNGSGSITNDFSKFIFKWNNNTTFNFNLYITIQFDNELGIAYNYGENTNKQLASYDNSNVEVSNISIPIGLVGSAATQYYSNNINTALTSIQNRKLDQEQAQRNKDFDNSKIWLNTSMEIAKTWTGIGKEGTGFLSLFKAGIETAKATVSTIGTLTNASINTAQNHYNYINNQVRANRELNAQINNIYSAPNINLANPFLKGVIPNEKNDNNEYKLFKHYAYELHPYDKKLIFSKLLNEGYIYNNIDYLQNFIVRKYMNILNINPYVNYSCLLSILKNNDDTYFNTIKDFDDFFIWLAIPKKIYNTNILINVLDWEKPDYVNNIFIEKIPSTITQKIDIDKLDWVFPKWAPNIYYNYDAWKKEIFDILFDLNDDFDADLWDNIDIIVNKNGTINISVVNENEKYNGQTFFTCWFWNYRYKINDKWLYVDNNSVIDDLNIDILEIAKHNFVYDDYATIGTMPIYDFKIKGKSTTKINTVNILYLFSYMQQNEDYLTIEKISIFPDFQSIRNISILNIKDDIILQIDQILNGSNISSFNIYVNNEKTYEKQNTDYIRFKNVIEN